jgi:SAM-dependent methyltransferase
MGTLRRITPLSNRYGFDRGTPIDRYYIEQFLIEHRSDIRGHVLEVKNSCYTDRFGIDVERRSVLDIDPSNLCATIRADLAAAHTIAPDQFDCFVLTQTLHLIFEIRSALAHAHRILRSGGVLLATIPSISRVDRELVAIDYWRLTAAACRTLFQEVFDADRLTVRAYGNVLAGTAFWNGMAAEELSPLELDVRDEFFPVLIAIRAVKT